MDIKKLKVDQNICFDEMGESPLPFAPSVEFANGEKAVPQQFIDVCRTLESVENVLADISLPKDCILFAGQIDSIVFLQVGIIGHENYPIKLDLQELSISNETSDKPKKIVYGRRWMLEPTTPTSEVVQTAFLAVKKAREHELRELLFWYSSDTKCDDSDAEKKPDTDVTHNLAILNNKAVFNEHISHKVVVKERSSKKTIRTTPFNSHMDLPLMVNHKELLCKLGSAIRTPGDVSNILAHIKFGSQRFVLDNMQILSEAECLFQLQLVSDIEYGNEQCELSEFLGKRLSFVCEPIEMAFMYELFESLLRHSDQIVERDFTYKGFARFKNDINIDELAKFSYMTRNPEQVDSRFSDYFQDMSYRVDASKAPKINQGQLGLKQCDCLSEFDHLEGYLPHGLLKTQQK